MFHNLDLLVEKATRNQELFYTDKEYASRLAYATLVGAMSVYLSDEDFARLTSSLDESYEFSVKWLEEHKEKEEVK